jgi:UDP-2,3-diacylglucosamine hydrolase
VIVFIADLHLSQSAAHLTERFEVLIQDLKGQAHQLYILGDLFEFWLGDDCMTDYHHRIAALLASLSPETDVFIMHGNRDFLLGEDFARAAKATLIPDPTVIDLNGQRTLLSHGDAFCTLDKGYQWFRHARNWRPVQWLFLHLPLRLRLKIAEHLRKGSQRQPYNPDEPKFDVTQDAIKNAFQAHDIQRIIHGHTHKPSIVVYFNSTIKEHFTLSDWGRKGHRLAANTDGKLQSQFF